MKSEFVEYILKDILHGIERISSRAMFGGHGIYKDKIIFGIIIDDILYFKVGQNDLEDYKSQDSFPFIYNRGNKKQVIMSYWSVPENIMNDEDLLQIWIEKAVIASVESKKKKNSKK
ncbi:MAG: TfoX/Sxy family protein [Promethearchaeota archaeon]